MMAPFSLLLILATLASSAHAWVIPSTRTLLKSPSTTYRHARLFSTPPEKQDQEIDEDKINKEIELQNISFDEAGKGLLEEEDAVRLEESGDFDTNPAVRTFVCCSFVSLVFLLSIVSPVALIRLTYPSLIQH
jgi:hypothetical protein